MTASRRSHGVISLRFHPTPALTPILGPYPARGQSLDGCFTLKSLVANIYHLKEASGELLFWIYGFRRNVTLGFASKRINMKKSKVETAKTRQKIVEVASKVIRDQGIDASGVAEIMATAGLTHGGFYRHFESKEELVTEALTTSLNDLVVGTVDAAAEGPKAVLRHFQEYVTPNYRDNISGGCPLAANGSEIVRCDAKTRHVATEGFRKIFEKATPFMLSENNEGQRDVAISLLTNMIGALTMSRMVDDPKLSAKILEVARRRIAKTIDVPLVPLKKTRAATA
jgi:TetR/AcrR family transcriptional repressor of nem operon